ncbi:hypothetical protein KC959_00685 [Candidatus Saccharibacteria bacterium]|nr:hypothetical protein [Candidatus Saccharibacteria bacterium]
MHKLKKILALVVLAGSGVSLFVSVTHIQDILDWWRLRDYTPSAEISQLAESTRMNNLGQKLFFVHDPEILDKSEFQTSCTVGEETIVLGCYESHRRIYLYNVTDERLAGVEEVTAAHEMLHAAYDRLSAKEKVEVNSLLQEAYDRIKNDRIRKNIASYKERDPNIVMNELHSILGTEVRDLPKDLEEYYTRYFSDRSAVVTLSEAYSAEFEKREKQIAAYDAQLTNLNGEITRMHADLELQSQALNQEKTLLESMRGNPDAFNEGVGSYNAKVNEYNADVAKLKIFIDQYNTIVTKRNEIAVEERQLVDAIDTRAEQL